LQAVSIEVEDNGIGISSADMKYLFERYWNGVTTNTFKNSNGLGLYLCKQIVDSHGGQIECESKIGKRTVFRVTLPVKKSSAQLSPTPRQGEMSLQKK
jgi:signal transduction histidine kinase